MGHPEPFDFRYVAVGNEDYGKKNYCGNYLKFYDAIRHAYPDIKLSPIVTALLDNLIILPISIIYDYHIYSDANMVFCLAHKFDHASHIGPKDFVNEYAVTGNDMNLLAALAVAGYRFKNLCSLLFLELHPFWHYFEIYSFSQLKLGSNLHDRSKEYVATLISQRSF
ncbi:hypothetical protein RHGRI_010732 [Rhododendron griersonianum]|uniref:Alpha-L-arabinofuranosidase 1 catalytic domain-containing protein n=1 Tax=Rhododendron griersonianum TaxID=479676 RepID=A0AAV6KK60_9ERIC|nr:hypothetical protein RHGRI_010732 [Rhododendron griersonianum]